MGFGCQRCRYREAASIEIARQDPRCEIRPVSFGDPDLGLLAFFQITTVKR
jgi:hypothetical protein